MGDCHQPRRSVFRPAMLYLLREQTYWQPQGLRLQSFEEILPGCGEQGFGG